MVGERLPADHEAGATPKAYLARLTTKTCEVPRKAIGGTTIVTALAKGKSGQPFLLLLETARSTYQFH